MTRMNPGAKAPAMARACVAACLLVSSAIPALSAGDPVVGEADFSTRCAACHATAAGQNKVGPSLAGVFGNASGTAPGFTYSAALKSAHVTWDDATLDKWLQSPSGLVRGTTMFASVPSGDDRQNIIAYLKTLSVPRQAPPAATP